MTLRHIALLFLAAAFAGCVLPSDKNTDTETPAYDFGEYYYLIQSDTLPRLQGDSLYVTVSYDCGPGHPFTLESFKTGNASYEIWLHKTERELVADCGVPTLDINRSFKIPNEIRDAQSVQLVTRKLMHIELKN